MSRLAHTLEIGVVAVVSAALGAVALLGWQHTHSSRAEAHGRNVHEEFVPEQALSLVDRTGREVGQISVSDDLAILHLYTAKDSWVTASTYADSSRVYIQCAGNHEATSITIESNGGSVSDLTRGFVFVEWKDLSLWKRLQYSFASSHGKRFDDSPNVPTEDLRLRNRKGWVFASLGLSSSGDPGIAFADSNGSVRLTFFQRQLGQRNWWDLAVWDIAGDMRVSVELHPGFPPDVVHFADNLGEQYVADFKSRELVRKDDAHSGEIPWLPTMQVIPELPLQLSDNRGRRLWSAP